ncbi:MAG: NlpC/P60 family protein [Leucobacter sp.]
MAGAAALSFGLVGTFSLPAYATAPEPEGVPDGFTASQTLKAVQVDDAVLPLTAPDGAVGAEILEQERKEKEAAEAAEAAKRVEAAAAAQQTASSGSGAYSGTDVPAGEGAQGIVNAALSQLGVNQDCTALVENSLRAVGIPAGDLGTQVGEYTALGGTIVTSGDYAPGDILVFPGQHVAVYVGNGQAVHGGWGGTTRLGGIAPGGETGLTVVRFF